MFNRDKKLLNKKIAVIATDGFEQSELLEPRRALEDAGATTEIISIKRGEIRGWNKKNWDGSVAVDKTIEEVRAADYDGVLLPGGTLNADQLRTNAKVVDFVKDMIADGKPIAAICHGPWTLIETGQLRGRTMTSWPSLKTDIENAGGMWVDQEVVTENGWVTSRKPSDIPAFNKKMIEEFAEGVHERLAGSPHEVSA